MFVDTLHVHFHQQEAQIKAICFVCWVPARVLGLQGNAQGQGLYRASSRIQRQRNAYEGPLLGDGLLQVELWYVAGGSNLSGTELNPFEAR